MFKYNFAFCLFPQNYIFIIYVICYMPLLSLKPNAIPSLPHCHGPQVVCSVANSTWSSRCESLCEIHTDASAKKACLLNIVHTHFPSRDVWLVSVCLLSNPGWPGTHYEVCKLCSSSCPSPVSLELQVCTTIPGDSSLRSK